MILDAGRGPGQWTNYLQEHGAEVVGVDLAPAFVERSRQRFPRVPITEGNLEDLRLPDGSVAGILSWYSIIHADPADVGKILRARGCRLRCEWDPRPDRPGPAAPWRDSRPEEPRRQPAWAGIRGSAFHHITRPRAAVPGIRPGAPRCPREPRRPGRRLPA
ncbi:class I SAM-dependent methyltransferase [Arthrobacter sp. AQ5-05]|uniref:class I SAM-dependent methyltransferase n=1 Tax=Arthrobacter sp. AQ5-05 TaxID=2184581 RepID=UPI00336A354D